MKKENTINARIDSDLKNDVQKILDDLGITVSEAIRIFFNKIKICKGIPFDVTLSKETKEAIEDAKTNKNYHKMKNIDELKKMINDL